MSEILDAGNGLPGQAPLTPDAPGNAIEGVQDGAGELSEVETAQMQGFLALEEYARLRPGINSDKRDEWRQQVLAAIDSLAGQSRSQAHQAIHNLIHGHARSSWTIGIMATRAFRLSSRLHNQLHAVDHGTQRTPPTSFLHLT